MTKRAPCPWTYERWDGLVVTCVLGVDHPPLVPWPHHAPSEPVTRPWKQVRYGRARDS